MPKYYRGRTPKRKTYEEDDGPPPDPVGCLVGILFCVGIYIITKLVSMIDHPLVGSVVVFIAVLGLLMYFVWRDRAREYWREIVVIIFGIIVAGLISEHIARNPVVGLIPLPFCTYFYCKICIAGWRWLVRKFTS